MRTFGINIALITSLWLAVSGCVADEQEPAATKSAVRGVATYDVESSASRTSVIGRDPQGAEVLRVDVTHGRIPVTADIREFYPSSTTQVDGRRFDVYLEGENVWLWTVAGFDAPYTLPAPSGDPRVRAFLQERHVKAVLDNYRLGFDFPPAGADGEEDYTTGSNPGTSPMPCTGTTCGNPRAGANAISMCGTGVAATSAVRMTHTGPAGAEWTVTQFCPSGSGGKAWPWVATKYCPTDAATQGTCAAGQKQSTCGCVTVSDVTDICNSCSGANEASYYGSVTWTSTQANYTYYKKTDTVGSWSASAGGGGTFQGNAGFINMTGIGTGTGTATFYSGILLTWTMPSSNCSSTSNSATCNLATLSTGAIYSHSQSSGVVIAVNAFR